MTAAFALTEVENWQEQYSITLYQLGWRLGGKGASGRNQEKCDRIQEHGLHVWGGWYDNAFDMIQRCYTALDRPPEIPIRTWDQAFIPHDDYFLVEEDDQGAWVPWHIHVPPRSSTPGGANSAFSSFADHLNVILRWVGQAFNGETLQQAAQPVQQRFFIDLPDWIDQLKDKLIEGVEDTVEGIIAFILKLLQAVGELTEAIINDIGVLIGKLRSLIWTLIEPLIDSNSHVRHLWILADFGLTTMIGIIADSLFIKPFDSINNMEYSAWLAQYGASSALLDSVLLQAMYDLVFAYPNGLATRENRSIEAGTGLRVVMHILRYKGSIVYKMAAGMGDVVFAPMYELLEQRGVTFNFFYRVKNLALSEDGTRIAAIHMGQQVTIKDDKDYQPLVYPLNLPSWPAEPLYDQIVQGDELQRRHIDLESSYNDWQDVHEKTLDIGPDDLVILGISIGAFPEICHELITKSDAWQKMVAAVQTVRTQSFQLWVKDDLKQLGWNEVSPLMGTIPDTDMDTWADMPQLIDKETWPSGEVGSIAYYTGVMTNDASPEKALEAVKAESFALMRHMGNLWPNAMNPQHPDEFNWDLLAVEPGNESTGVDRFWDQFFRANIDPTELYVLTATNTTQFRLKSGSSGFSNLYLAGDWTDNRTNIGMVEGAVMSGLQACQAITGYPVSIPGEGDFG